MREQIQLRRLREGSCHVNGAFFSFKRILKLQMIRSEIFAWVLIKMNIHFTAHYTVEFEYFAIRIFLWGA